MITEVKSLVTVVEGATQTAVALPVEVQKVEDPALVALKQLNETLCREVTQLRRICPEYLRQSELCEKIVRAAEAKLAPETILDQNLIELKEVLAQQTFVVSGPRMPSQTLENTVLYNTELAKFLGELNEIMKNALDPSVQTNIEELKKIVIEKAADYKAFAGRLDAIKVLMSKELKELELLVADYEARQIPAAHLDSVANFTGSGIEVVKEQVSGKGLVNQQRKERHDKLAEAYSHAFILGEQVEWQLQRIALFANCVTDAQILSTKLSEIDHKIVKLKEEVTTSYQKSSFDRQKESFLQTLGVISGMYKPASDIFELNRESTEQTLLSLGKMIETNGNQLNGQLNGILVYDKQVKASIDSSFKAKMSETAIERANLLSKLGVEWKSVVKYLGTESTKVSLAYEINRLGYSINSNAGSIPTDWTYRALIRGWVPESLVVSPFEPKPVVVQGCEAPPEEKPAEGTEKK